MTTLSNYLQLLGLSAEFIGFIILFFNLKLNKPYIEPQKIHMNTEIIRHSIIGGDMNDKEYSREIAKEIVKQMNESMNFLVGQLNVTPKFTKYSWGLIGLGFIFQLFGLIFQIYL